MQAAFSPLAGRLSDRVEPRIVASAGMAITALGVLALAFVDGQTPALYIVGCLVVLGLGFALFSSPNSNAVMSSVTKDHYGVASATLSTMRLVGQMLSMGIAMLIIYVNMGRTQVTPQNHPQFIASLQAAFGIFAVVCFAGVFASLARGRMRAKIAKRPTSTT